jgi:hypothetical protein
MQQELCGARPGVTYEVAPDFNSNAPIILVTIEANTPEHAVVALDAIMNRVPPALTALQRGLNLRPQTNITSMQIVTDTVPEVVRKDQIRAGIVAGAGTLALGLLMIALLDGWLASRWESRSSRNILAIPDWSFEPTVDDHPNVAAGSAKQHPTWSVNGDDASYNDTSAVARLPRRSARSS